MRSGRWGERVQGDHGRITFGTKFRSLRGTEKLSSRCGATQPQRPGWNRAAPRASDRTGCGHGTRGLSAPAPRGPRCVPRPRSRTLHGPAVWGPAKSSPAPASSSEPAWMCAGGSAPTWGTLVGTRRTWHLLRLSARRAPLAQKAAEGYGAQSAPGSGWHPLIHAPYPLTLGPSVRSPSGPEPVLRAQALLRGRRRAQADAGSHPRSPALRLGGPTGHGLCTRAATPRGDGGGGPQSLSAPPTALRAEGGAWRQPPQRSRLGAERPQTLGGLWLQRRCGFSSGSHAPS